ncbi:F0F1 ATP synthase subunit delta [Achromobacter ruhlandii]|uniref:F0F1 ATP synthase subunit delta n=1 Tax=Achromobacter ruhlandii TaxID=72557 RepID=UPI0020167100
MAARRAGPAPGGQGPEAGAAAAGEVARVVEVAAAQVQGVGGAWGKKWGLRLEPVVRGDESWSGGGRGAVGDQVLDTSVQAQLARMRDTLAA